MDKLSKDYFLKLIEDYLEAERGKESEELEDFLYDNSCSDIYEFFSVLNDVKYTIASAKKEGKEIVNKPMGTKVGRTEAHIYFKNTEEIMNVPLNSEDPLNKYEISLKDGHVTIFNENRILSYKQSHIKEITICQELIDNGILIQTIWEDGEWIIPTKKQKIGYKIK